MVTLLMILILLYSSTIDCVEFRGKCGHPGTPAGGVVIPDQDVYSEGAIVVYECAGYSVNREQTRTCTKGKWTGAQPRCGDIYDNDLIRVDIYSKNVITNSINVVQKPNNFSFRTNFARLRSTSRVTTEANITAKLKTEYTWHLILEKSIVPAFIRIDVSVPPDEQLKGTARLKVDQVFVNEYRDCKLVAEMRDIASEDNTLRQDFWFECDLISEAGAKAEKRLSNNKITFKTITVPPVPVDLAGLFVVKGHKSCGKLQIPLRAQWEPLPNNAGQFYCKNNILPETRLRCGVNMIWEGMLPNCSPGASCSIPKVDESLMEVVSLDGVWFDSNLSHPLIVEDTEVTLRCKSLSRTVRQQQTATKVCKNKIWVGNEPMCSDEKNGNGLIIGIVIFLAFVVLASLFAIVAIIAYSKRIARKSPLDIFESTTERKRDRTMSSHKKRSQLRSSHRNGSLSLSQGSGIYDIIDEDIYEEIYDDVFTERYAECPRPEGPAADDDGYVRTVRISQSRESGHYLCMTYKKERPQAYF